MSREEDSGWLFSEHCPHFKVPIRISLSSSSKLIEGLSKSQTICCLFFCRFRGTLRGRYTADRWRMGSRCSRSPPQNSLNREEFMECDDGMRKPADTKQRLHVPTDVSREGSSFGPAEGGPDSPTPPLAKPGLKGGADREATVPQPTADMGPSFDLSSREKAVNPSELSIQEGSREWAPATSSLEVNRGGEATGESFLWGPGSSTVWGPEGQQQQQQKQQQQQQHPLSFSEGRTRRWQASSFPSLLKAKAGGQGDHQAKRSDSSESQHNSSLDQPVKTLFINFFKRNLTEQRRHEEALESAGVLPVLPNGSITLPESEICPEGKRQGPIFADGADEGEEIVKEAEVEAANAISLFSPDERNTRFEEFSMLVKADQKEYQAERRRGEAVRGPKRASTIGTVRR
ncbi:hypothetical protein Emag_004006 [Eimeria magna]